MNELDRLEEPWEVIEHPSCFQVVDATGRYILSVSHRQDLQRGRYTHAGNYLNAREAETIANAVAEAAAGGDEVKEEIPKYKRN